MTHAHAGEWSVLSREGNIHLRTGRIGFFKMNASAPIVGGEADWSKQDASLTVLIGINEVNTGNRLMDSQVRNLVAGGSDGVLTFHGEGNVGDDAVDFEGSAWAGDVKVPMSLVGEPTDVGGDERDLSITGQAVFSDIKIPIPGLSHIDKIEVTVEGLLKLSRKA